MRLLPRVTVFAVRRAAASGPPHTLTLSSSGLPLCPQGAEDDTAIEWEQTRLESFTGSGILLEEDQTYSAEIRFLDRLVE